MSAIIPFKFDGQGLAAMGSRGIDWMLCSRRWIKDTLPWEGSVAELRGVTVACGTE